MTSPDIPATVLQFLAERIDTVPQLEALLLMWENPQRLWSDHELAARTLTVGLCAFLLLRAYACVKQRLLLWSGLCFVGLTISNAVLFIDLSLVPQISMYTWRLSIAAASMLLLLYGLILESD